MPSRHYCGQIIGSQFEPQLFPHTTVSSGEALFPQTTVSSGLVLPHTTVAELLVDQVVV